MIRIACLLGTIVLLAAGCSSTSDVVEQSSGLRVSSVEELHFLSEEAIQQCMREQGFDYQVSAYVFDAPPTVMSTVMFTNPEPYGYGAVLTAVASRFLPSGAPSSALSREEEEAYFIALIGNPDLAHSHDEGEDEGHSHDAGSSGCQHEAEHVRQTVVFGEELLESSIASLAEAEEEFSIAVASPEFAKFTREWLSCMNEAGYTNPDPTQVRFDVIRQSAGAISDLGMDKLDEISAYVEETTDGQVRVAGPWFDGIVAVSPELGDLLDEELTLARIDSACRAASSEIMDDVWNELSDNS